MDKFREEIKNKLLRLDDKKKILVAILTCEKLFPNYLHFNNTTKWGNPIIIENAIMLVRHYLLDKKMPEKSNVQRMILQINSVTPNTEDFSSIEVSFALDACTAIYSTLCFLVDKDIMHIIDVASYARDTVDMFIQEKENLEPNDPFLESKIQSDPFMVAEIAWQNMLFKHISLIENINDGSIKNLRDDTSIIDISLINSSY